MLGILREIGKSPLSQQSKAIKKTVDEVAEWRVDTDTFKGYKCPNPATGGLHVLPTYGNILEHQGYGGSHLHILVGHSMLMDLLMDIPIFSEVVHKRLAKDCGGMSAEEYMDR